MRLMALIACTTLLALVAACGGDDSPSVTEWADAFCTSSHEWGEEIARIGDEVARRSSLSRETLEQAALDAREATEGYVAELSALGAPDVEASDEIESALDELAEEVEAESDEIDDAIDDMTGLDGLVTAAREIGSSAAAMFTALERTLDAFDATGDDALEAALRESNACAEIAG